MPAKNCPDGATAIDAIRTQYDTFFRVTLFKPGSHNTPSWYAEVDWLIRAAFKQDARCLLLLPQPPHPPPVMDAASTPGPRELGLAIGERASVATRWCLGISLAATCIHRQLPDACRTLYMDLLNRLLSSTVQLSSRKVDDDSLKKVCKSALHWMKDFYEWGVALRDWENAVAKGCVSIGDDKFKFLQVTPPPWPPWGGYDETDPDGPTEPNAAVQMNRFASADNVVALENVFEKLLLSASQLAARTDLNKLDAFPHGLTEITAQLSIQGQFSASLTLKGPEKA